MKKQLILLVAVMIICVGLLSGCNEEKENEKPEKK